MTKVAAEGGRSGAASEPLGDNGVRGGRHRLDRIREYVLATHSASPSELAQRFGVSVMTIHRDLAELEQQGVVRRFRGGVTALPSAVFESSEQYRLKAMETEKDAIAAHAVKYIEAGMAVLLDDSTTCVALARRLKDVGPLSVVTNHLGSLGILSQAPEVRLTALGGEYDPRYNAFVGMACIAAVEAMKVDAAFLSAYGVAGRYVFHQEQQIVAGKRAMLGAGERKILLVDHSKLGRKALHQVAAVADFDLVVVDDGASVEALRGLEAVKAKYELARMGRSPMAGNPVGRGAARGKRGPA